MSNYVVAEKLVELLNENIYVITTSNELTGNLVEVGKDYIVLDVTTNKIVVQTNQIVYFHQ